MGQYKEKMLEHHGKMAEHQKEVALLRAIDLQQMPVVNMNEYLAKHPKVSDNDALPDAPKEESTASGGTAPIDLLGAGAGFGAGSGDGPDIGGASVVTGAAGNVGGNVPEDLPSAVVKKEKE